MRLAITGGIAEGKSTVLKMLAEEGLRTASADLFAREVLAEPAMQARVCAELGLAELDRGQLLRRILDDPDARRTLNALLHGPILDRLEASGAQVWEVPLLVETCLHARCDRVWVVTCGPTEQRRRLLERLADPDLVEKFLKTQLSSSVKACFADEIIRTDRSLSSVLEDVRAILTRLGL